MSNEWPPTGADCRPFVFSTHARCQWSSRAGPTSLTLGRAFERSKFICESPHEGRPSAYYDWADVRFVVRWDRRRPGRIVIVTTVADWTE